MPGFRLRPLRGELAGYWSITVRANWRIIFRFGLTIAEAAAVLGVTRQTFNNLVNGKSGVSADMAVRLDKAFGGSAETWLRLQMAYDLAQARQHEADIDVKPVSRRKLQEPHP